MFKVEEDKCVGCGVCIDACPEGAISMIAGKAVIDEGLCVNCGKCVRACPHEAIFPGPALNDKDAGTSPEAGFGSGRGMGKGMGRGLRRGPQDGSGRCGGGRGRGRY